MVFSRRWGIGGTTGEAAVGFRGGGCWPGWRRLGADGGMMFTDGAGRLWLAVVGTVTGGFWCRWYITCEGDFVSFEGGGRRM